MAKYMQILFVALLAVALVAGEPRRFQGRRNRFLARQELEEPVTPYPSADELKPEVPFDEAVASEGQIPSNPVAGEGETPFTPVADNGETPFNPVGTDDDNTFIPAAAEGETPFTPDEVYGPPEEEENVNAVEEEYVPTEEEIASARLTARRAGARRSAVRSAKLRKPVRASPAKLRKAAPSRLQVQPQYVPQPIFYYISQ